MNPQLQIRILWTAVIILGVGMLVFGVQFYGLAEPSKKADYSAVYLESGDVYFGRLSYFPRLTLTDVHFLTRDGERVTISSFKDAALGPEDRLYLNAESVLWIAKLRSDSPTVDVLKGIMPNTPPPSSLPEAPIPDGR
jgi:hypothetical protein